MKPTNCIRHVWREINDGNQTIKVLALQQWFISKNWKPSDHLNDRGEWRDVPIIINETTSPPNGFEW
jgi:hypothetical protein